MKERMPEQHQDKMPTAAVRVTQDSDIIMNHNNGFTVDRAICHLVL